MGDFRGGGRFEREPYERTAAEPEPSLAATFELGFRRLVTSVFVAGGLVAIAVYASGGEEAPRYQVTAADGRIVRVNTESGTVIACQEGRCAIVLRRGQDLEDSLPQGRLPAQPQPAEPKAAPALPSPAPAEPSEGSAR